MTTSRLTRNARRCDVCHTVIESLHRHDYRVCGCENHCMVDGGLAYLRWGAVNPDDTTDLSEWTDDEPRTLTDVKLISWGPTLDRPCDTCEGRGTISQIVTIPDVFTIRDATHCPDCGGTGNTPVATA